MELKSGFFVVLRLGEDSCIHSLVRRTYRVFGAVAHKQGVCEFQCPDDVIKVQEFLGGVKQDHPLIDISFHKQSALVG
jgi:hypothetical protein